MIYVASPYTDKDPAVRAARYMSVYLWTMNQIKLTGKSLFAPIAYTHNYALDYGMPFDAKFWYEFNDGFIRNCEEVWILMLPGWKESVGVQGEIKRADELGKPVIYKEIPGIE